MILHNIRPQTTTGTTTFGCMWNKGECTAEQKFFCRNQYGDPVSLQSRVTAWWPDGSIKWTSHTAECSSLGNQIEVLPLSKDSKTILPPENLMRIDVLPKIADSSGKKTDLTGKKVDYACIYTGSVTIELGGDKSCLFDCIRTENKIEAQNGKAVLKIENPINDEKNGCPNSISYGSIVRDFSSRIDSITIEEHGSCQTVIRFEGIHQEMIPFVIRMYISADGHTIRFMHTFMYDGDENRDFLKGIGISFERPIEGALFNRHIKMTGDSGIFHEVSVPLMSWRPRIRQELYVAQMEGLQIIPEGDDAATVNKVIEATPYWDKYVLCQDSPSHFAIKKKLAGQNLCYVDSLHGMRSTGTCAFGGENGSVLIASKDFWQTYPSGIEVSGLSGKIAEATIWFWSPEAQSMDFRHYADRGYNQVCYEGYDYKGATPYGIAVTSECALSFEKEIIPADKRIEDFCNELQSPALFVGTPEYYHQHKAFGYWSLPKTDSESEIYLEKQLEKAFEFYKNEVEQRNWYGLFNYGDMMHSYDPVRHQWKYDVGGYAWDNTELVPTLWLWLYFMRTGREDVFTLAQKLSRHASETDVYHFGKYKGLGSRHNVRHWGCPCKEARIAMAHHHRFLYYLTGDYRLEDIFDELKDNEMSFLQKDPLGDFYPKDKMVFPSHARSGPDWSSLVSNWMTQWERKNDSKYLEKIKVGLEDIKKAPLQFSSGPDFEFDPHSCHLRYIGENTTGGCHLQICMGAPQIWLETADLMESKEFFEMLANHGRFYFLTHEEQLEESKGIIGDRQSTLPFMATALGAYGAEYLNNQNLAEKTWRTLLETLISENNTEGFETKTLKNQGNQSDLKEIPWITTNFTAQWCLNVIMVLEFIRESLPKDLNGIRKLLEEADSEAFRKA